MCFPKCFSVVLLFHKKGEVCNNTTQHILFNTILNCLDCLQFWKILSYSTDFVKTFQKKNKYDVLATFILPNSFK